MIIMITSYLGVGGEWCYQNVRLIVQFRGQWGHLYRKGRKEEVSRRLTPEVPPDWAKGVHPSPLAVLVCYCIIIVYTQCGC